ncbi:MAG: hypothetical protein ACK4ND_00690 [Cytophagaceae bacterium]
MNSSTKVSLQNISFISTNSRDETGKVFTYNGKIFRAIYKHKTAFVKELLGCGLIEELNQKGMFPKTTISDIELEGFELVLEHEVIYPVVLPPQWTFDMLKDAGEFAIVLNQIALKYGYQTMDCHGYNILFKNNDPVYIDFGSFIKVPSGFKGWFAYENFLQSFYYPLKIAEAGNWYFARLVMLQPDPIPHYSFYYFKSSLYKLFKQKTIDLFLSTFYKFKLIRYFSEEEIKEKTPVSLKKLTIFLNKLGILPFQSTNLNALAKKVKNISIKNIQTEWGAYHNDLQDANGLIKSTLRFDQILSVLKGLEVNSVLELGGNQGVFSRIISERTNIETIICTDYDETAVNLMYNLLKKTKHRVTPALLNFVTPNENYYGARVYERFKSDAVFALALSHHLILTQKMSVKSLFEEVIKYSNRYVFIEFMPMGLYSDRSKRKIVTPEWYNVDWFRGNFGDCFTILHEEQLEKNRILFVGEIK